MSDDTPLFLQYKKIKKEHPNEVLFFRLGDFYEMFESDAIEVSRILNLTLTHRGERPMCGIPYHAARGYIARLLRYGKKIAIAEQIGEVSHGKGLTERKVIEIITPGTAVESEYLEGSSNNFLASFFVSNKKAGFAYIDVTTGEFRATSFSSTIAENFAKELGRCLPRELLLPDSLKCDVSVTQVISSFSNLSVSWYPDWNFQAELSYDRLVKQFKTANLSSFSLEKDSPEVPPAGFLLDYLAKTTNTSSSHITGITLYQDNQFVIIDDSSRKNLEILSNLRDGGTEFTLFECLNCLKTAMGLRMQREWLAFPLTDSLLIKKRQNHVCEFVQNRTLLKTIRCQLDGILDVERLAGRIAMDRAHAKDLKALEQSLSLWLNVRQRLKDLDFTLQDLSSAKEIISLIQNAILDDPSTLLTDGNIIRPNWSKELDKWREIHDNFNKVLDNYLEEEKEQTGIQNLRIRNSSNMGYFIEVTKGKLSQVPPHFIMRRSLLNAERFTTEKLQELEQSLNESSTKILELERDLFLEVRGKLKNYISYLLQTAQEIAYIDVVSSLAHTAVSFDWICPVVDDSLVFEVTGGRHPVVERHIPAGEFVPNNLSLLKEENSPFFALITGPNMAGKSTFLRQNALIALLAQTGSFVPCQKAHIGVVDKIFCRVGASDNLARGESTFLVEMTETARILRSATKKSLVIMDEVGRGTSTEDGLSIAWAVSEYLMNNIKCKTLFATHYHELTRLEHSALKMLCMAVSQNGKDIVFLRKVIDGASENSYGIHVAKLAGIPEQVINRAQIVLSHIQKSATQSNILSSQEETVQENSLQEQKDLTASLFSEEELIVNEIRSLSPNNMTPIEALQTILRWKSSL